jgi:hypothetical protein
MSCQVFRNDSGEISRVTAPNGEESELYKSINREIPDKEEALKIWAQVYTQSFKDWFGDWEKDLGNASKVVDKNGEPLVVYHAGANDIEVFKEGTNGLGKYGKGIYFTPNRMTADEYSEMFQVSKIYPVFLNIKSPLHTNEIFGKGGLELSQDQINERTRNHDGIIRKFLYPDGFDLNELTENEIGYNDEYIVFKSNQIKSVSNNGNYSKADNNIYHQQEPQSQLPSNEEINRQVESFLEKIGVSVHAVRDIRDKDGKKINAIAKADMLNKIVEVVQDRADITTLPEEAAHFFVEMLGENHPLLKEMMGKITGYSLYPEVVNQYKNNKSYRNEDGTINFTKVKKEAIGKLIAEHIIKQEYGEETEAKLTQAMNWWNKLLDFLRNLFSKAQVSDNPFAEVARKIRNQDTEDLDINSGLKQAGEFYQLDESLDKLNQDQEKIKLDNSVDPVSGQKRHIYTYDGEQARGSVTGVYVDPWLKKKFPSDRRSEKQKLIDLAKAEYGDIIHEEMQNIVRSWTDENGVLKDTQGPHAMLTDEDTYNKLNRYFRELVKNYPPGTIFKAETKVYDKKTKVAGSIDFLAIQPDGTVDMLDWKSQEIGKGQDDLKAYKSEMYRIQLENYRKILQLQYGFEKFGKIRAIPIRTEFVYDQKGISKLKQIEIGTVDPSQIPDGKDYLLPVTLKSEGTGDEEVDEMLKKLHAIYDKIAATRYGKDELYKKRDELGKLNKAIRDLQLRGKMNKLIELGLLQFNKYSEKINSHTLTGKDIMEAEKILQVFNDSGIFLYDMMQDLHEAAKENKEDAGAMQAYEDMKNKFLSMTARTGKLISDIAKYRDQEAQRLGQENGVDNLLKAEAPIGPLNGMFAALSKISRKSFETFSKILQYAQHKRDVRFTKAAHELDHHKAAMKEFAVKKGISEEQAWDMMLGEKDGKWNGNFLAKYKSDFYKLRDEAIKKNNLRWMLDNLVFDDVRYKEVEKDMEERFHAMQYELDAKKNEEAIQKKLDEWRIYHNVQQGGKINEVALFNPSNHFLKPKDSWKTDKWQELNKPENKVVKDAYDYFQSLNRKAEDLGMLDKFSPGFFPSMGKTKVDQLVFGNYSDLFNLKRSFADLEVDSGTQYSPEVDPTDGSVINRIPVYYTRDMGVEKEDGTMDYSQKSKDLFKVYAIWAAHMANYEAMQSIEDDALILLETERHKQSLVKDRFGNVVLENGQPKAINNNDHNAKILEDIVHYYLYDKINGKGSDMKLKVAGKEYSALKLFNWTKNLWTNVNLGLNPVSGTSQFVGGTGNAFFMAQKGKFFTKTEWAQGMKQAVSDKKAQAAIDWLNPHLEGNKQHLIDHLSMSKAGQVLSKDTMFMIQRKADAMVQNPVAIAMLNRHMIVEGKIVDINQFVKDKYNYNDTYYKLSKAERKTLMDKIEKEVTELKDTKSLLKVGVLDKNGKFSVPGLEDEDKTLSEFRNKVKGVYKKMLGNVGHDDINQIRTTMLGMALMQFRNWIPDMMEERFAGLKYDHSLGTFTYGKTRMFFSEVLSHHFPNLVKSIVTGFGDDMIKTARETYGDMRRKALERGEEFNISEGEFIDLYQANIRSQMAELLVLLAFTAGVMLAGGSIGGPGNDDKLKGAKLYMRRALGKYYNEFSFYYNPTEFTSLVKNPLPIIGLAEDFTRFTTNMGKQLTGAATGNESMEKKAHPSKYFFRMFPVSRQALQIMAAYDDDFRKTWDVKLN